MSTGPPNSRRDALALAPQDVPNRFEALGTHLDEAAANLERYRQEHATLHATLRRLQATVLTLEERLRLHEEQISRRVTATHGHQKGID